MYKDIQKGKENMSDKYREAGVNLEAGYESVRLKAMWHVQK